MTRRRSARQPIATNQRRPDARQETATGATAAQQTAAAAVVTKTDPRTALRRARRLGHRPASLTRMTGLRGATTPANHVQRLIGFEVEASVPSLGTGVNATNTRFNFQDGPQGTSCPDEVKQFLLGGLGYGVSQGSNANFDLSADHNKLHSLGLDIHTKLSQEGLVQGPSNPYTTISNLEYKTDAVDELAPGAKTALDTKIDAMVTHLGGLMPNAKTQVSQVAAPANNVYTGVPVQGFQNWLGTRHGRVKPKITAFQNAVETSNLYLQATAGIIPSALPDLYKSRTSWFLPNVKQVMANRIRDRVEAMFKLPTLLAKPYISEASEMHLAILKGICYLAHSYLIGDALNRTNYLSSTSKNAVPFLSQTNLADVVGKAGGSLASFMPPTKLLEAMGKYLQDDPATTVDWWVQNEALQADNTRGHIVNRTGPSLLRAMFTGENVGTVSTHNRTADTQQDEVKDASAKQKGIPLEYRYIEDRPSATGLKAALWKVIKEVRNLNTKHLSRQDRNDLIDAADT